MNLITLIIKHPNIATAIPVLVGAFWSALKFRDFLKDKRFRTYHELIDDLVNEQRQPDRQIKLDRQVAIIFELRNFTSYYPVTRRILTDLKLAWVDHPRAIKEIDLTLSFISKNWLVRLMEKLWKI